jgi:archaeosine-15-forming tRNA-guanine transglycosylase
MLYFQRVLIRAEGGGRAKGEIEPDTDRRILTTRKSNYARRAADIALRYREGVFVLDDGSAAEIAAAPQNALADLVVLDLIEKYHRQGREVGAKPSANYAPHVFAKDPAATGLSKAVLTASMNRLLDCGKIALEDYGPPSKSAKRLVVVPETIDA